MSFISILKTIGADIEKGLKIAEPIVAAIPGINILAGPIIMEVASIIADLEGDPGTAKQTALTPAQLSALIQAIVTAAAARQVANAAAPTPAPPPTT